MYITNPSRKRKISIPPPQVSDNPQAPKTPTAPTPSAPPSPSIPNPDTSEPGTPQPSPRENGAGYIIVRVTTASGAIPLEDALVTVKEYESNQGEIISVQKTNSSGLTNKISLPAPPKPLSMSAGRGKAYSSYNIDVKKDGYIPQQYINVPIFDGVTAMQNADMVPLPENGESDRYDPYAGIFYESENPKLESTAQEDTNA